MVAMNHLRENLLVDEHGVPSLRRDRQSPPPPTRPAIQWSTSRTFFPRPCDPIMVTRHINKLDFGQFLANIIPNPDDPQQLAVEQLVRTATGDWKVQIARGTIQLLHEGQEIIMERYGKMVDRSIADTEFNISGHGRGTN